MAIHQEVLLNTAPARVYQALLSSKIFSELTGAPAEISAKDGGEFAGFGGQVTGRNIELRENHMIVQAWRVGPWAEGVYSVVRFTLDEEGGGTKVTLDHTGFPEDMAKHLEAGWHKMYWGPLQDYFK